VNRGTNPLDPSDDIVKKEELKVEVGKAITLEGVTFATGSANLTPTSETILEKAYNTLAQNPEIAVEIQGHTDNTGKKATNMKLSQARADAVKAWLVAKGIDGSRIATKGYGPDKPVAPNTSAAGRQKNRRIEFFRSK
jgi:outer membrane protein OmpA-like peptidoglycan-associated protein